MLLVDRDHEGVCPQVMTSNEVHSRYNGLLKSIKTTWKAKNSLPAAILLQTPQKPR